MISLIITIALSVIAQDTGLGGEIPADNAHDQQLLQKEREKILTHSINKCFNRLQRGNNQLGRINTYLPKTNRQVVGCLGELAGNKDCKASREVCAPLAKHYDWRSKNEINQKCKEQLRQCGYIAEPKASPECTKPGAFVVLHPEPTMPAEAIQGHRHRGQTAHLIGSQNGDVRFITHGRNHAKELPLYGRGQPRGNGMVFNSIFSKERIISCYVMSDEALHQLKENLEKPKKK